MATLMRYMVHTSAEKTMTILETPPVAAASPRSSPWHSPVPYLFGGLAAMLGLIAFALLILACSYWRLSGYLEGGATANGNTTERDLEAGDDSDTQKKLSPAVLVPQFLVIMPGQEKPTCLATPMSSRASSFGSSSSSSSSSSTSSAAAAVAGGQDNNNNNNEEKNQETHHTRIQQVEMSNLSDVAVAEDDDAVAGAGDHGVQVSQN